MSDIGGTWIGRNPGIEYDNLVKQLDREEQMMKAAAGEPTYTYSFFVRPCVSRRFHPDVYSAFLVARSRTELEFTEKRFDEFRANLAECGFVLLEIERAIAVEPERVE